MKNTFLKNTVSAALMILLIMIFADLQTLAQEAKSSEAIEQTRPEEEWPEAPAKNFFWRTLEGSWNNQVTIRNCQTGQAIRAFAGLLTFHQGGTLSETAAGSSPALRSPGHGTWRRTGWRRYEGKFTLLRFNPDGTFAGTQKTTQNIELDQSGNGFNDTATLQIFDANGNQIVAGCATAVATRLE